MATHSACRLFANDNGNLHQLPSPDNIERHRFPNVFTVENGLQASAGPESLSIDGDDHVSQQQPCLSRRTAGSNSDNQQSTAAIDSKLFPSVLWKRYGAYTDANIPAYDVSVLQKLVYNTVHGGDRNNCR